MKVSDLIETLNRYNPNASVEICVRGTQKNFELCYGGSEGCTPENCENVTFMVETSCEKENTGNLKVNNQKEWIFSNSPFEMLDIAFRKLFPTVKYTAFFEPEIRNNENGEKVYGLTDFGEDGTIAIFVDSELTITSAVEIFAHELAHAGVGIDHDHDEVWEQAFDDLFEEYNKIGEEMFPTTETKYKCK